MKQKLLNIIVGLCLAVTLSYSMVRWMTQQATYYRAGEVTASGEPFDPRAYTCAVKDRENMGHWYRITYGDKTVYCWANDVMPKNARADFDLSEAAFKRLADTRLGRIQVSAKMME